MKCKSPIFSYIATCMNKIECTYVCIIESAEGWRTAQRLAKADIIAHSQSQYKIIEQ